MTMWRRFGREASDPTITDDHCCKPFSGVGPTRRRTHSLLPQASQDFGESHERENATEGDGLGNPCPATAIQPRRSVIDLRHAGVTYNAMARSRTASLGSCVSVWPTGQQPSGAPP